MDRVLAVRAYSMDVTGGRGAPMEGTATAKVGSFLAACKGQPGGQCGWNRVSVGVGARG